MNRRYVAEALPAIRYLCQFLSGPRRVHGLGLDQGLSCRAGFGFLTSPDVDRAPPGGTELATRSFSCSLRQPG